MDTIREKFAESLLLRWVTANMVGWIVGLIGGGYLIRLPDLPTICFPLIALIGGFAGASAGLAQWIVLRQPFAVQRRWILMSFLGAALASLPAYFVGIFLFIASAGASALGSFAAMVMGALVGGGMGAAQSVMLEQEMKGGWIAACALAGSVCGLLSLLPILPPLPIGILLGTALYGYITGRALLWLFHQQADMPN